MAIEITTDGLLKLSTTIKGHLDTHKRDRQGPIEEQLLKNLRQYRAKYDPKVADAIPKERSHAYPRDTRIKVTGYVAKLMEMMFPSQEKNWELKITDVPSIPKDDLTRIIESLEVQEQIQAQEEQREPTPVTSKQIERRVLAFANERKDAMEKEISDQLDDEDTDYQNLCKRVLRSGAIYGIGVARSPMVRKLKERVWELNEDTGEYDAKVKMLNRPFPEFVRVWDLFPDFSAHSWKDQDRIFERMVMGRMDFKALGKRNDFDKDAIDMYLVNNSTGNYREAEYETTLRVMANNSTISNKESRRYEVYRFLGMVDAHELTAAGVEVPEEDMGDSILADIWIIDDIIIKAEVAVFGDRPSDQYPAFIASEDENSGLIGVGLPEDIRDSQMGICASTRATYDNMGAVAGPIFEVNVDLLPPGATSIGAIHAFMVIEREGEGDAALAAAVRQINTESHIPELQSITRAAREQLHVESGLPAFLFGDPENVGEAFRTTTNLGSLTSGANLIAKDSVRAYDRFTSALVGGLLKWNMEFNDKPEIKGDFSVRAKGAISLSSKEVQGAALDQMTQNMTEEERAMTDSYGLLEDKFKSRDLPTARLLPREQAEANVDRLQQAGAAAAQSESALTESKTQVNQANAGKAVVETQNAAQSAEALTAEILSKVELNLGKAKSGADKAGLENLKLLLEQSPAPEQGGQE